MPSKEETPQPKQGAHNAVPWYRQKITFLSLLAPVFIFLGWILLSGPTALQNSRILPDEVNKTWHAFSSWLHEDEEWTGTWSATPEGYVDFEEMLLSDTDLIITLSSSEGNLSGTVASKSICRAMPLFNFNLLEGSVSALGSRAEIKVFDHIGGKRLDLGSIQLRRNGPVMDVIAGAIFLQVLPVPVRIARHPNGSESSQPEPMSDYCAKEREALFEKLRNESGDEKIQ
ncbi:hypothetical protein ABQE73_09535 [Xanthomonas campestris pv. campestris]|uniref:hypothetical protein n=1 Tax=Xanthomonas campestris TaxID=339 RepID=UPI0013E8B8A3|nr:hypothetical protein [Xanthomonas campestris]MCC5075659.1 hypothetical protein [Xanthomonas campestris pv. campestris]MEB1048170.1 hypothetical protein [Xanthomonas campestris pv. campestris]